MNDELSPVDYPTLKTTLFNGLDVVKSYAPYNRVYEHLTSLDDSLLEKEIKKAFSDCRTLSDVLIEAKYYGEHL